MLAVAIQRDGAAEAALTGVPESCAQGRPFAEVSLVPHDHRPGSTGEGGGRIARAIIYHHQFRHVRTDTPCQKTDGGGLVPARDHGSALSGAVHGSHDTSKFPSAKVKLLCQSQRRRI